MLDRSDTLLMFLDADNPLLHVCYVIKKPLFHCIHLDVLVTINLFPTDRSIDSITTSVLKVKIT